MASSPARPASFFSGLFGNADSNLQSSAESKGSGIFGALETNFSQLPGKATEWFGGLKDSAITKAGELFGDVQTWPGKIQEALGSLGTTLIGAGQDLMAGLGRGIDNNWQWLKDKVGSVASDLLAKAKSALGITSPSKLFRDEVGKWIPAGLGDGIIANARLATDAAQAMADKVTLAGTPILLTPGVMALPTGALSGAPAPPLEMALPLRRHPPRLWSTTTPSPSRCRASLISAMETPRLPGGPPRGAPEDREELQVRPAADSATTAPNTNQRCRWPGGCMAAERSRVHVTPGDPPTR